MYGGGGMVLLGRGNRMMGQQAYAPYMGYDEFLLRKWLEALFAFAHCLLN